MARPGIPSAVDPLLRPFLRAVGEEETQRHLEALLKRADPWIRQTLRRRFHFSLRPGRTGPASTEEEEAADVHGETQAQLLQRLRALRQDPQSEPIRDFKAYVVATTAHVFDHYLRRKYPQRWRLKKRLRDLLTHQPGLALWESRQKEAVGGFADWEKEGRVALRNRCYLQLLQDPQGWSRQVWPGEDPSGMNLADLVAALFSLVGSPMALDDLVAVVAALQGVPDLPAVGGNGDDRAEGGEGLLESLPDPGPGPERRVVIRAYLQQLWAEILLLPRRQRMALLLNLRLEGRENGLELWVETGLVRLREIAAALEMSPAELAELWNHLPLEDGCLAQRLGITRQQVINLRRVARARLRRRMGG